MLVFSLIVLAAQISDLPVELQNLQDKDADKIERTEGMLIRRPMLCNSWETSNLFACLRLLAKRNTSVICCRLTDALVKQGPVTPLGWSTCLVELSKSLYADAS